jgi:hypothetical protein
MCHQPRAPWPSYVVVAETTVRDCGINLLNNDHVSSTAMIFSFLVPGKFGKFWKFNSHRCPSFRAGKEFFTLR